MSNSINSTIFINFKPERLVTIPGVEIKLAVIEKNDVGVSEIPLCENRRLVSSLIIKTYFKSYSIAV